MTSAEIPNEEKTAEAMKSFLAALKPDQVNRIIDLPPEDQLEAALQLAKEINAVPWPTHDEMTGRRDPLTQINWNASPVNSSLRPTE